jgi:hypothetical protein
MATKTVGINWSADVITETLSDGSTAYAVAWNSGNGLYVKFATEGPRAAHKLCGALNDGVSWVEYRITA